MPKLTKSNGKYTIDKIHLSQANEMYLECGECLEVDVKVVDKRHITDQQRKFILPFAMKYRITQVMIVSIFDYSCNNTMRISEKSK